MAVRDAVEALEAFLNHLRARGVRSFKGDLLKPNGTKQWTIEVVFEPERPSKPDTERDPFR